MRPADNTIPIALTGPAPQYTWGLNDRFYPYRDPYWVERGQRVEMVFSNPTPMGHPMHLHGHEFQILEINGEPLAGALRDTVLVPKGGTCRVAFDANNPGVWAFHCHIAYHHVRGMFNVVAYRSADLSWWGSNGIQPRTAVVLMTAHQHSAQHGETAIPCSGVVERSIRAAIGLAN